MEPFHINSETIHYLVSINIEPLYNKLIQKKHIISWAKNILSLLKDNFAIENFNNIFAITGDITVGGIKNEQFEGTTFILRPLKIKYRHGKETLYWLVAVVTYDTAMYIKSAPEEDRGYIVTDMLEIPKWAAKLWHWREGTPIFNQSIS